MIFAFLSGAWAFTSYYLRFVFLGLFAVAVLRSNRSVSNTTWSGRFLWWTPAIVLITILDVLAIQARFYPGTPVELSFPLKSGTFYVLQGGANALANPFHGSTERYALDLVKLNSVGNRASAIAPENLNAYATYGEAVHSPCTGKVIAARDGLPDNSPGRSDAGHPEGNHVLLRCGDASVLLAHLMGGSIRVETGGEIEAGAPLARVGNSGNTSEPHLHISAEQRSASVPLAFGGATIAINDTTTQ